MEPGCKLNLLCCFLLAMLMSTAVDIYAQPCNVMLTTQAEVDAFPANYGHCDSFGLIHIKGNDITNLDSLIYLDTLFDLTIESSPGLLNLRGLDSLRIVYGTFDIKFNNNLLSLDGLSAFTRAEGLYIRNNYRLQALTEFNSLNQLLFLYIQTNTQLQSLSGFEHGPGFISPIYFNLSYNPRIKTLDGLQNIETLFDLGLYQNDSLANLDALENLTRVHAIMIVDNPLLQNIQGLQHITGGLPEGVALEIINNDRLKNLQGLNQVDTLIWLKITMNDSLASLEGLNALTTVLFHPGIFIDSNQILSNILALQNIENYGDDVSMHNNPLLNVCSLPFLCNYVLDIPDSTAFEGNGPGCNSPAAITASCADILSIASGLVYLDVNCNHLYDSTDIPVPNVLLYEDNGFPMSATGIHGTYLHYLNYFDTISYSPIDKPFFNHSPDSYTVENLLQPVFYDTLDFGICVNGNISDAAVRAFPSRPLVPGFPAVLQVCVQNIGAQTENMTVTFDLGGFPSADLVEIISTSHQGIITDDHITWILDGAFPLYSVCFDVDIKLDPSAVFGDMIFARTEVTITNVDENASNNTHLLKATVVSSFDPNAKLVSDTLLPYTNARSALEYTILFQNTGNFPATFIEVRDTLPAELDMRSLDMIGASHDYSMTFPDTNIIQWRFDDIQLPDSTTNEPESHGFIHFSIPTRESLPPGTVIINNAAIYFDFNEPVITADAVTVVELPDAVDPDFEKNDITIEPSPAYDNVTVRFQLVNLSTYQIDLIDMNGIVHHTQYVAEKKNGWVTTIIPLHNLPAGLYYLRLVAEGRARSAKLVIAK